MDFINALDPSTLLTVQTTLAFLTAPFDSPGYNFPLFLFGVYAIDKADSYEHLRMFTGFLGFSFLLDIIWLFKTPDQNGLVQAFTIINMLIKIPTFLALLLSLRQRGDRFGSLGEREFGNGATVWSMPGGLAAPAPGAYQSFGGDLGDIASPLSKPQPPTPTPAPPAPTITRVVPGPSLPV